MKINKFKKKKKKNLNKQLIKFQLNFLKTNTYSNNS